MNIEKILVCRQCAQEKALQIKSEEEMYRGNFISYVEAYCEITHMYEQNGDKATSPRLQ